jgi:hypothetical protein
MPTIIIPIEPPAPCQERPIFGLGGQPPSLKQPKKLSRRELALLAFVLEGNSGRPAGVTLH